MLAVERAASGSSADGTATKGAKPAVAALCTLGLLLLACRDRTLPITVTTGEWSPYVTATPDGVSPGSGGAWGPAAEIVTAALRDTGYEPTYEFLPWGAVERLVREGRIEAAFPFVRAQSRDDAFCYSAELGDAKGIVYTNKSKAGVNAALDALPAGAAVGTVKGYEYPEEILGAFATRASQPSETEAFAALIAGDISYLPAAVEVGEHILETTFAAERHLVGTLRGSVWKRPYYFVVPSRGPRGTPGRCDIELLRRFDTALDGLREAGVLSEITGRYEQAQSRGSVVLLRVAEGHPQVYGVASREADLRDPETRRLLIPDRTPAVVVEWDEAFRAPVAALDDPLLHRSRVRLLGGPARNELVWVPDLFIAFDAD